MSYSRWSYSRWYTFWSSVYGTDMNFKLPTQELKNKQTFEICDLQTFYITYGEIKEKGFKKILKEVEDFYIKEHTDSSGEAYKPKKPKKKEMSELYRYLELFVADVDEHFYWDNFFTYEWYYPIKNKIRKFFTK